MKQKITNDDLFKMSAVDLIKYLNGRTHWHGSQYRSICGRWLNCMDVKKQAIREIAEEMRSGK